MITFTPNDPNILGFIPSFLNPNDPRSAKEQIDANYIAGWNRFDGFKMLPNGDLTYPGDPVTRLLSVGTLRDETIYVYEHAWVAIVQPNGHFEIARLD